MDEKTKPLIVNIELYECSESKISSKEHIQEYVLQLCKMLEINRLTDIRIEDDGGVGYIMYQPTENAYISAYFMPSTKCANITIFSLKPFEDRSIAIFSYDFFVAGKMDLNFLCY